MRVVDWLLVFLNESIDDAEVDIVGRVLLTEETSEDCEVDNVDEEVVVEEEANDERVSLSRFESRFCLR